MNAPEEIRTERLLLRRPHTNDLTSIFENYASRREVGDYLAWPVHTSLDDTRWFIDFSDAEWDRAPAGPYLVCDIESGEILGSTGLAFESPTRASTGYVIAPESWGNGLATEAVIAMRDLSRSLGVERLYAGVHTEHRPSQRVLEKAGFELEGTIRRYCEFPNLRPGECLDVLFYSYIIEK